MSLNFEVQKSLNYPELLLESIYLFLLVIYFIYNCVYILFINYMCGLV